MTKYCAPSFKSPTEDDVFVRTGIDAEGRWLGYWDYGYELVRLTKLPMSCTKNMFLTERKER